MHIRTRGQAIGLITAVLAAIAIVWLAAGLGWTWRLTEWDGWPALSLLVLVGAWINVLAWATRSWPVSIVCSLLIVAAPWGFIYPGILAGPILAIAAGLAWARESGARRGGSWTRQTNVRQLSDGSGATGLKR